MRKAILTLLHYDEVADGDKRIEDILKKNRFPNNLTYNTI